MGIDIYLRREGRSKGENAWGSPLREGQQGYIREAHSGGPFPSSILVPEAFESDEGARISATTLRARLPDALRIAKIRFRRAYGVTDPRSIEELCQDYRDFVDLCEKVERETGTPPAIIAE